MFFDSPQTVSAVSASATAAQITTNTNPGYVGFAITPTDATVYVGDSTVSSTNGQPVPAGVTWSVATKTPGAYYVRTASGTADVRVVLFRGSR